MLVFAAPPVKKKDEFPGWTYHVYFRTAGAFAKRRGDDSHDPGTMKLDDARGDAGGKDFFMHGGGTPRGRCYEWFIGATRKGEPMITKKRVGDRVRVQLLLHATTPQSQTVRLAAWPSEWPAVRRAVKKIGCRA